MYLNDGVTQVLRELHMLQELYVGSIDISIETRKDLKLTAVTFCTYIYDEVNKEFHKKSKLYVHKILWNLSDYELKTELMQIKLELAKEYTKLNENNNGYIK